MLCPICKLPFLNKPNLFYCPTCNFEIEATGQLRLYDCQKLLVVDYENRQTFIEIFDPEEPCEICALPVGSYVIEGDPTKVGLCFKHLQDKYDEIYILKECFLIGGKGVTR